MIWGYVLAFVTALIIVRLTSQYAEMRNCQLSGYLFAALYLASMFAHPLNVGQIVTILVLLSYFPLFSSYEELNPSVSIFLSSLLLGLASLVFSPVKWLVPILWVSMAFLRSFNIKTLIASVLGVMLPAVWILAIESVWIEIPYIHPSFAMTLPLGGYSALTTYQWSMAGGLGVLFIYGTGVFSRVTFFAKSKTRTIYRVITLQSIAYMILMFISPQGFQVWYMMTLLNVSLVLSRMIDRQL